MKALRHPPAYQTQCPTTSTYHCRHITSVTVAARSQRHTRRKEIDDLRSSIRTRIRSSRLARREDWILGPLAPNRAAANPEYGCLSSSEYEGTLGARFGNGREELKGGRALRLGTGGKSQGGSVSWKDMPVYEGDRVVVVSDRGPEARERGRIGLVKEVRRKEREVVLDDMNNIDIAVPEFLRLTEPNLPPIRTLRLPIPFSSIRLIAQLTINGRTRDCIIEKLQTLPDRAHRGKRYILNPNYTAGTTPSTKANREFIEIPLPKTSSRRAKKDEDNENATKHKDHDCDTLRFQVDETTWTPTLLRAPLPSPVIDELRNKYGRHRSRHEPLYLLARENREKRQAAYKAWAKGGGGMLMTPGREAGVREREELKRRGRMGLGVEVLEGIGQLMRKRGVQLTEGRRERVKNLEVEKVLRGAKRVGEEVRESQDGEDNEVIDGEEVDGHILDVEAPSEERPSV